MAFRHVPFMKYVRTGSAANACVKRRAAAPTAFGGSFRTEILGWISLAIADATIIGPYGIDKLEVFYGGLSLSRSLALWHLRLP